MNALVDDNVSIIGVYGMGGVGKTTLVQEVIKEAEEKKLIDEFAMAVVSQTPNVSKIQSEIASMLGLTLDKDESEHGRAGKLCERLSQDKRSLVILDDLWKSLKLSDVGIPPSKGCKLILTSRDHNVCRKMNTNKDFQIEILPLSEALVFFKKEVGHTQCSQDEVDEIEEVEHTQPWQEEIVRKCGGLLIAIKALAKALKGQSQVIWANALDHLRNSTPEEIEEISSDVYSVLKFSFSVLEPLKQSFFLLCALFGEDVDIPIEYLMRFGKGLKMFQDGRRIQAMRNATRVLIEELKARSLLLDGKSEDSVRMHDVIRDFAKFMASEGTHKYLVKERLEEWPYYSELTGCTAISLLNNNINVLPDALDCPSLEIFIFQSSRQYEILNENFFAKVVELKVLNINSVSISSLPQSPSEVSFPSLEELVLDGLHKPKNIWHQQQCSADSFCRLIELTIDNCKSVETVFSFIVMKMLQNLELIDIRNCESMKEVCDEECKGCTIVFRQLLTLQLTMLAQLKNFGRGCIEFPSMKKMWVMCCPKMKTFLGSEVNQQENIGGPFFNSEVSFPSLEELVLDGLHKPKNIWHQQQCPVNSFYRLRELTIRDCNSVETAFTSAVMQRLQNLERIDINNCKSVKEVCVEESTFKIVFPKLLTLELRWLPELKHFGRGRIEFPSMKKMVVEDCVSEVNQPRNTGGPFFNDEVSFPSLEELVFNGLDKPKEIWHRQQCPVNSFCRLRELTIRGCNSVETAFTSAVMQRLQNLERIDINNCKSMKEICVEEFTFAIVFPKLLTLELRRLPKLKHFGRGRIEFPSMKKIVVEDCVSEVNQPQKTGGPFFNDEVSFPTLEELVFNGFDKPKEIWHRQQCPVDSFCRLRELTISGCNSVETAFTSAVMQRLQNLEHIDINNCKSMKEVCVEEFTFAIVFPKLLTLELRRLPELKHFGRGRIEFPSIKTIVVEDCVSDVNQPRNTGGPFFSDEVSFPSLEELVFNGLDNPNEIWHREQCPANSFCRLRELRIKDCNSVKIVFSDIVMQRLQNLKCIDIENCESMKEVCDEGSTCAIVFPKLITLKLRQLPELKHFGRGHIEFPSMKMMWVRDCPKMKTFVASEVNQAGNIGGPFFVDEVSFLSLEELMIDGCKSVCDLLSLNCEFPKLITLELRRLQNLEHFGRGRIEFPSMKMMWVRDCPKMKTFVASEVNQPGNIGGPFFNDELKVILPVLEELKVEYCDGLSTILPSYLLQTMKNLKKLTIHDCWNLEELVNAQEEQGDKLVFPVLHSLSLWNLPNLRSFCSGYYTFECPSLQSLEFVDCPNMRTFCSGTLVAPKLSDYYLSKLKETLPEQVYSETSEEAEATEEGAYGQKSKEAEGGASTSYIISRQ